MVPADEPGRLGVVAPGIIQRQWYWIRRIGSIVLPLDQHDGFVVRGFGGVQGDLLIAEIPRHFFFRGRGIENAYSKHG